MINGKDVESRASYFQYTWPYDSLKCLFRIENGYGENSLKIEIFRISEQALIFQDEAVATRMERHGMLCGEKVWNLKRLLRKDIGEIEACIYIGKHKVNFNTLDPEYLHHCAIHRAIRGDVPRALNSVKTLGDLCAIRDALTLCGPPLDIDTLQIDVDPILIETYKNLDIESVNDGSIKAELLKTLYDAILSSE